MTAFLFGGRMKLIDIINNSDNELQLEEYLIELGLIKSFTHCPFCNNDKFGVVRRNKLKCYRCKREWSKKLNGPLVNTNVSTTKIVLIVKLLSLGVKDNVIADEANLNWNTYKKVLSQIKT